MSTNLILDFFNSAYKMIKSEFDVNKTNIYIDKDIETIYFYLKDKNFKVDKTFYDWEAKISKKFEKNFPGYILIFTWKDDPEYLNISFDKETELLVSYEG